jgi:hypothetical protein
MNLNTTIILLALVGKAKKQSSLIDTCEEGELLEVRNVPK